MGIDNANNPQSLPAPMSAGQAGAIHILHSRGDHQGIRVLIAAEGTGGHLIPALEVSRALVASSARARVLYARRPQTAGLFDALIRDAVAAGVEVQALPLARAPHQGLRGLWQAWQAGRIWRVARQQARAFDPSVVVGFGGWFSIPVVLMARRRRLPVLLHEQNVRLGRANRLLLKWADQVAVSFPACPDERGAGREATGAQLNGTPRAITGLPIRAGIGAADRDAAARRFGLNPRAGTVLVLGGSQGAGRINRLMCEALAQLTAQERASWQFIHLTGVSEATPVEGAYRAAGVRAFIAAHLSEMPQAYALADVVVARAGASTIAELAQGALPAVLIPYPYAGGHQRANARLVEAAGGGVRLEETSASSAQLLSVLRQILFDDACRQHMAERIHSLAKPDATARLASAILHLQRERC